MIPCYFDESQDPLKIIPPVVKEAIESVDLFIVENVRSARRFLRKMGVTRDLDDSLFHELNKFSEQTPLDQFLKRAGEGKNIGMISEAGCPGIADPGAMLVRAAHQKNIEVVSLPGPSSIFLALMGSGLNGQKFTFHGYLPIPKEERIKKLKQIVKTARDEGSAEIFMETPFRNNAIFEDIILNIPSEMLLCIACNLTLPGQFLKTDSINYWKKNKPDIQKKPCIFIIGREG